MIIGPGNYDTFVINDVEPSYVIDDHLGGFNKRLRSPVLDRLQAQIENSKIVVKTEYIFNDAIKNNYQNIEFKFDILTHDKFLNQLTNHDMHSPLTFNNFLCSFNGSLHVSRKLLVSILNKFRYFDPEFSSKNFTFSEDVLSGHIEDYVNRDLSYYSKFFMSDDNNFFQKIYSFGHNRFDHSRNIYNLEHKLTQSFLHIVSETMATSYYPFVTEKFLYSIVTRGLFLAYAHPGWHAHVEKYYGFRKYNRLFDYRFDTIQNPVERLVELMTMISKFSMLSTDDWHDLYEMEKDAIEYNYDHYFSGGYLKSLEKYV